MSGFKGTPGPWEVVNSTDVFTKLGGQRADGVCSRDNDGWQIADCSVGVTFVGGEELTLSRAEQKANARLLAAAPDLLEACQTFAEWLRREEGGFPAETRFNTPEGEARWREWFDENLRICDLAQTQARAAIAKATGAQP